MLKHKIKHKMRPTVKHKELYPWQKYPPGSASKRVMPENFNERECRAHTDADAFVWMVFWGCIENSGWDIKVILTDWWNNAYTKDFPEKGGTVKDLTERIYCRLIDNGHAKHHIDPEECDYELPSPLRRNNGNWKAMQDVNITLTEEDLMKIKLKKKVSKTGAPPAEEKLEASKASKGKKQTIGEMSNAEGNSDIPKWVLSSRPGTKAHESKVKCIELLLERKYTDEEIILMVESEVGYSLNQDRINFYRYTLNKGRFEPFGFKAPSPQVERIGEDEKPASSKKSVPAKKASAKKVPSKKAGTKKSVKLKKK